MTPLTAERFLTELRNKSPYPSGKLELSTASKIQTQSVTSLGRKTQRLCLDALPEDCFKIAVSATGWFIDCWNYRLTQVTLDGRPTQVWVNINSIKKRLNLPLDVISSNLSNLERIVQLVREKQLFQVPLEESPSIAEEDMQIPLLPIDRPFPSLIPLEEILKMANEQSRCFHLSKRCYQLAQSVDVCPGGFIAVRTGTLLGSGANGKVKISTTLEDLTVARRSESFDLNSLHHQESIFKCMKTFDAFRKTKGILDTLAMGIYENKKGRCKFISFHPLYDQSLDRPLAKNPSQKDRLDMTYQLLQGLSTLAEQGIHRDLHRGNIFIRKKEAFEAVIGDLEFFRYHHEGITTICTLAPGPEDRGMAREVWDLGNALYYLLEPTCKTLPWDSPRTKSKISQKNLDQAMAAGHFSFEAESLLRGMLAIDSNERWTARASLDYFERRCLPKYEVL